MKKLVKLFILFIALSIYSCGISQIKKASWENIGSKGRMVELYDRDFSEDQLDSIFVKDTLSPNLDKWVKNTFGPDKDGKIHTQYVLVKKYASQDTYIVEENEDSTFNVIKRTIIFD